MVSLSPIELLLTRRSTKAANMVEPGPSKEQLNTLLEAAHRVPDHKQIGAWRFIVFTEKARAEFGEVLRATFASENPDASDKLLEHQQQLFTRAPCVISVVASPDINNEKVPVWEQTLSVGAVCQNLLLASHAIGFSAQWLTEWYSYSDGVNAALNLGSSEQIAGFIYIGTAPQTPDERPRPSLEERIEFWTK